MESHDWIVTSGELGYAFSCVALCRACLCVTNAVRVGTVTWQVQMSDFLICTYPDPCRAS